MSSTYYSPNIQFNDWFIKFDSSGTTTKNIDNITFSATAKTSNPWNRSNVRLFFGMFTYSNLDMSDDLENSGSWYEVNGPSSAPEGSITATWNGLNGSITSVNDILIPTFVFRLESNDVGYFYICVDWNTSFLSTSGVTNYYVNQNNTGVYFYTGRDYNNYMGNSSNGYSVGYHGINCLLKGTKILTPFGYKLIENLKEGDIILNNNNEEKEIKKMYSEKVFVDILNGNRDMYKDKYLLKNGDNLIVSGGHMIKVGDEYHLPINSDLFENIQKETGANHFYHIELDTYDFFIANGVEVESLCREENLSQKEAYYSERGLSFQDLIKSKK